MSFEKLLFSSRPKDAGKDLWTVFNVIQENLIRGGIEVESNGKVRRSSEIKCIHKKTTINQKLWELANKVMVA